MERDSFIMESGNNMSIREKKFEQNSSPSRSNKIPSRLWGGER